MLDSLWDPLLHNPIVFAFLAYLLILFQMPTDPFRDRSTSDVAEALC
ncbi:hypothetical protein [Rhodococcus indonesiensis]